MITEIKYITKKDIIHHYTITRVILTYISLLRNDYNNTGYILLPKSAYSKLPFSKLILLPDLSSDISNNNFKQIGQIKNISWKIYGILKHSPTSVLSLQNRVFKFVHEALKSQDSKQGVLLKELLQLINLEYTVQTRLKTKIREFQHYTYLINYFNVILQDIVPEIFNKVSSLTVKIAIVPYGSVVSYSNPKKIGPKEYETTLLLREDANFTHILEGYLSSLVYFIFENPKNVSWYTQEQFVDFLIQYTKLNMLFKDYVPTIFEDKGQKDADMDLKALYTKSREFLKSMGFDQSQDLLLIDNYLVVHGIKTKIKLTEQESKLLSLLLLNRNQVVDYFYIGDILWPNNPDKFSIWAIAKLIQKIRYKLYKAGFDDKKLMNVKGKGYMLA